jgi:hypothetical protein
MKTNQLIMTAAMVVATSQLWGATVNITVQDPNTPTYGFNGGPFVSGTGQEDNETEQGTIKGQVWDMEAFAVSGNPGSKKTLSMIGGYNFTPSSGTVGGYYGGYYGGDIFIKVGGGAAINPIKRGVNLVQNGVASSDYATPYNYTFAIDMSRYGEAGHIGQVPVYELEASTWLETIAFDDFRTNPFRVRDNLTPKYWTGLDFFTETYTGGFAPSGSVINGVVSGLKGDGGVDWGSGVKSETHYMANIDMGWLSVAAGTDVYLSYTMGCGNDGLKGSYGGGFRVPDTGATLMLLGLGFSSLAMVRRKI